MSSLNSNKTRSKCMNIKPNRIGKHCGGSSAFSSSAKPDEDWTKIKDLAERRRIQNRIAQRNYRQKQKAHIWNLERRAKALSTQTSEQSLLNSFFHPEISLQENSQKIEGSLLQLPLIEDYQLPVPPEMSQIYPGVYGQEISRYQPPSSMHQEYACTSYPQVYQKCFIPPGDRQTGNDLMPNSFLFPSMTNLDQNSKQESQLTSSIDINRQDLPIYNDPILSWASPQYSFGTLSLQDLRN